MRWEYRKEMDFKNIIRVIFFTTLIWEVRNDANTPQPRKCPSGTYLYHSKDRTFCNPCPVGTFMPWKNHTAKKCFHCTQIQNPKVEIVAKPCETLHDTDIQCVDGFYRHLARNSQDKSTCRKCKPDCPEYSLQIFPCQNFTDLECCPREKVDNYGNMCRKGPNRCSRGQYLDTEVNDCKPCPDNTYMPDDHHANTECWGCQYKSHADLPIHVIITQPCTNTQSPRYECENGFYLNHTMSYRGNDIGCSLCQSCKDGMYVGRHCNMYHDTVCCDKPGMPVLDVLSGGFCIDIQGEVLLHPHVGLLRVREGHSRSLICYIALAKGRRKPKLLWVGPNMDKHEQFQFEKENNQTDVTVYYNTLTVRQFSSSDDGTYRCKDSLGILTQDTQLTISLACEYGSYNPPSCDKNCSQNCGAGESSDVNPCDNNNGTCLFGCLNGYTGSTCERYQEQAKETGTLDPLTISIMANVILTFIVMGFCVSYTGCCRRYTRRCGGYLYNALPTHEQAKETGTLDPLAISIMANVILTIIVVGFCVSYTGCCRRYTRRCGGYLYNALPTHEGSLNRRASESIPRLRHTTNDQMVPGTGKLNRFKP